MMVVGTSSTDFWIFCGGGFDRRHKFRRLSARPCGTIGLKRIRLCFSTKGLRQL